MPREYRELRCFPCCTEARSSTHAILDVEQDAVKPTSVCMRTTLPRGSSQVLHTPSLTVEKDSGECCNQFRLAHNGLTMGQTIMQWCGVNPKAVYLYGMRRDFPVELA